MESERIPYVSNTSVVRVTVVCSGTRTWGNRNGSRCYQLDTVCGDKNHMLRLDAYTLTQDESHWCQTATRGQH